MKQGDWVKKRLNLGLRTEVILNIAFLMMIAILLIGFTISKINERNIISEKIRYGGIMVQDFQNMIDFISMDKKEISFENKGMKKEVQDFCHIYIKSKGFYEFIIVDVKMNPVVSKNITSVNRMSENSFMKNAIQTGEIKIDIDKTGTFLITQYRKMLIDAPLWNKGKIIGGVHMAVPIGDITVHLLESQRVILITVILDSIVLIIFGSFLLSRVFVKPIKDLVQLINKISEGDFNQKLEANTKNEIGQLIGSFNRMTERLKEKQEKIEKHLESLETANKQLKQAQEELLRTEKLASIGRFAAGVAHEVGNPLGSILGYTGILQKGEIGREESKDLLMRIEKEIERINRIVRELLDYAKPGSFDIQDVDINKVIESTLSLLSYQKNFKNIEMRLDLSSGLPAVKGNDSQLSQVLINIILNAIDAMPHGGHLDIQTSAYVVEAQSQAQLQRIDIPRRQDDPLESDYYHLRKARQDATYFTKYSQEDRLVKIRIADTGIGIAEEDLEKIFDPFFTTKEPDKGTGLGLSICLRIVESLGGELRVESEKGKGSAFEIYFPAVV